MCDSNSPTRSWKWLVFTSRFSVMFFLTGSVKTGGILFNSISSRSSGTFAGFVLLIPYAVGRLCGPLASTLLNFFSYRFLGTTGGFLVGLGYILIGIFGTTTYLQILFLSLSGIGFACLLLPVAVCMKEHFGEDFASVMPLSMIGTYVSVATIPPIMEICRVSYGEKGTFVIFGAICWHLIPCGLLLRKPTSSQKSRQMLSSRETDEDEEEEEGAAEEIELLRKGDDGGDGLEITDRDEPETSSWRQRILSSLIGVFRLFLNPIFLLFFIVSNTRKIPADGWTLFLIPHTIEIGFTPSEAATVASVGGLAGIVGRLLASISFSAKVSPILMFSLYYFLNGIIFIVKEMFDDVLSIQFVGSAFNGCLLSAQSGMIAGLLSHILEPDDFKDAFGVLDFGNGVLALMAGIIPGYILDRTGNLSGAFLLFGAISILNGILIFLLWALIHYKRKRKI